MPVTDKKSVAVKIKSFLSRWGTLTPLRPRYIYTRSGRLRLRLFVLPSASFMTVFATIALMSFDLDTGRYNVFENKGRSMAALAPGAGTEAGDPSNILFDRLAISQKRLKRYMNLPEDAETTEVVSAVFRKAPEPKVESVQINKGDTLAGVLQKAGLTGGEAYLAVKSIEEYFDPRGIKPGQKLDLRFDPQDADGNEYKIASLEVAIDPLKSVIVNRDDAGAFSSSLFEREVKTKIYAGNTEIETSLYGSALKADIPAAVIADTIRIYSWDVDFQRDIRRGDLVEVMYEQLETDEGVKVKSGDVLYARLNINGRDIPVYRYEMSNGDVDYFDANGASLRKALMKTPVDGARLSSGFGPRKHPVLGYNKMHKGVDFAAPSGTPIYAAGDGTVEKAGRWGAYGNYIRIRHNSNLKTAYAHMKGFAKGMSVGKRVKQGQVIGYIGTTGRSTGPHLHYEVLVNGQQVSPSTVKLPQGENLKGKELESFRAHMKTVDRKYKRVREGNEKFAALN